MNNTLSSTKNVVVKASAVAALVLSLAVSLPAQADGQMIDDTGLVITSNADGTLREFQLQNNDLSALKITEPAAFVVGPVLRDTRSVSLSGKYPTNSLIAGQGY